MDNIIKDSMAEKSVLGAILLDNSKMDSAELVVDDFYHESHKLIFSIMAEKYNRGETVDLISLQNALIEKQKLDDVGGLAYLFTLQDSSARIESVFKEHTAILKKKSKLRKIELCAKETISLCRGEAEPEEILERLQGVILDKESNGVENIVDIFAENNSEIEQKLNGACLGVKTNFIDIDRLLGGLQRSDLIILAARPSMGKTALALNIASNIAIDNKGYCLIFSLEMSAGQLINRVVSALKSIPSQHLLRPNDLTDDEWKAYWGACRLIEDKHLDVYDGGNVTPAKVRKVAKAYKAKGGLDLIIVDYLQLMRSNKETGNKVNDVGDITRDLKLLARELDVPIILLSQLSRAVETRENKRPVMSDLRDSGSIEQDADIVMFLYREGYYDEDFEHQKLSELIVRKHRSGPLGTIFLTFENEYTCFKNASPRVDE